MTEHHPAIEIDGPARLPDEGLSALADLLLAVARREEVRCLGQTVGRYATMDYAVHMAKKQFPAFRLEAIDTLDRIVTMKA